MKKILHLIMLCVPLLLITACDVHEFPGGNEVRVPFLLHLDFNTELPLYKEVVYTRNGSSDTKHAYERHDIRYTIKVYRSETLTRSNREAFQTYVFTKSDIEDLNFTAPLELPEGEFQFQVWADYVDAGSTADKYYDTRDFSEIILAKKYNHPGSNDFRDAFRGYATATVMNPEYYAGEMATTIDNRATAEMRRPMGKFKFVSNDVDMFITRVEEMIKEKGKNINFVPNLEMDSRAAFEKMLENINLAGFKVVFRYNLFMPCSFNMFTDKPADSWTGMSFESQMYSEEYNEMTMGYDYIFVNGSETTLSISVDVYDKDGELLSSTNPINVPIVRSKLTLVTGDFLTSKASEGVSISPDFDGEYNIVIK